jgi:MFS superfamily sulfate permease-like transporter
MRSLVFTASASLLVAHAEGFMAPVGPQMRTMSMATAHQVPVLNAKLQPKWHAASAVRQSSLKMAEAEAVSETPAVEEVDEVAPTPPAFKDPEPVADALAGLTVAFSLLSKAIACSAIVGVSPLVGLWSSVFMGLITPLIGGRPGVISGTAAVVIVPLAGLTMTAGVQYMAPCIVIAALMQMAFGVFNLAKYAKLVTPQVLSGFLNGLGFILLMSQAKVFTGAAAAGTLAPTAIVAGLCYAIIQYLPKFTTAIPSSLAGLLAASGVATAFNLPLKTLAQAAPAGTFSGGLSTLPGLINPGELLSMLTSISALKLIVPVSISITIIALVETLLAGQVVDELTNTKMCPYPPKKDSEMTAEEKEELESCVVLPTTYDVPKRSVISMATANIASALFGGFGGCGLIPQTVLNIKSGGGGPLSVMSYAFAMAFFIVIGAPLVGQVPEAALAGVMLTVGADTVAWAGTANAIRAAFNPKNFPDKKGKAVAASTRLIELLSLGVVSYVCYFGNLAVGIIGGIIMQAILMKANNARLATA